MRKVLYIFGVLSDLDVEWMTQNGVRQRIADGHVLIREGEAIDALILVLDGTLLVSAEGLGEIARLGAGELVGEMSLVDSAPPSATVSARGECLVLFLAKAVLTRKLETDMAFGCRFYRALAIVLADRLRGTTHRRAYGEGSLDDEVPLQDELDVTILDNLSLAGDRFERMLKTLGGGA